MRKEKIILSAVAVLIGLLVAVAAFYLYQKTKALSPNEARPISKASPTPTPIKTIFISLDKPNDEEVFSNRIITVAGKTTPGAKVLIATPDDDQSAQASSDGSFSTTITIDSGENIIVVTAIGKNGEEAVEKRVVSYSTEEF